MPIFTVKDRNSRGKASQPKVKASTSEKNRSIPKNKRPAIANHKKVRFDLNLSSFKAIFKQVTVKDKAIFSRQFAAMANSGVPIVSCLSILSEQCPNPKLKNAVLAIGIEVQNGTNLSEAMRKHPDCFDVLYISMVKAGETAGTLDEVLNRLAKLLEDMARLKNQIKSAMTYPITVGIIAIVVFFAMTVFLIPIFAAIFKDLDTDLPALTQFMLFLSGVLRSWTIVIPIAFIFGASIFIRWYYKTPIGRLQIDSFLLKMPLFGELNLKSAVARFCRVFGTLTRAGVPILNTLDIVQDTSGNQVIANAVEAAKREIQRGGMISFALQQEKVFPLMAIQMIRIGEEGADLDAMLMKIADFYEDEVEQAVKALTSIIEPIMMVLLGGMVAVILLSMYLPLFKVFETLG